MYTESVAEISGALRPVISLFPLKLLVSPFPILMDPLEQLSVPAGSNTGSPVGTCCATWFIVAKGDTQSPSYMTLGH